MVPYTYIATITSVYDGDSIHAMIDLGFGIIKGNEMSHVPGTMLRLRGCNAIELSDPGGEEAKANLESLLPVGTKVVLHTTKVDKYGGRYDVDVTLPDGRDLVTVLIEEQWAAPWDGQGEKPTPPWPRTV